MSMRWSMRIYKYKRESRLFSIDSDVYQIRVDIARNRISWTALSDCKDVGSKRQLIEKGSISDGFKGCP